MTLNLWRLCCWSDSKGKNSPPPTTTTRKHNWSPKIRSKSNENKNEKMNYIIDQKWNKTNKEIYEFSILDHGSIDSHSFISVWLKLILPFSSISIRKLFRNIFDIHESWVIKKNILEKMTEKLLSEIRAIWAETKR